MIEANGNISNDKVLLNSQVHAHLYIFGKNQLESFCGGGRCGALTLYSHNFMVSVSRFLWCYFQFAVRQIYFCHSW